MRLSKIELYALTPIRISGITDYGDSALNRFVLVGRGEPIGCAVAVIFYFEIWRRSEMTTWLSTA
jgi:hypothetical protein